LAGATVRVISGNFITARPVGIVDGVDFQHSGLVRRVDVMGITQTLNAGSLVLLSPFGFSPTGEAFNLTMEEVATSVATALQADKLIFVSEVLRHSGPTTGTRKRGQPDRHRVAPGCGARPLNPTAQREPAHRHRVLSAALCESL